VVALRTVTVGSHQETRKDLNRHGNEDLHRLQSGVDS
jgi:hypothetical protein